MSGFASSPATNSPCLFLLHASEAGTFTPLAPLITLGNGAVAGCSHCSRVSALFLPLTPEADEFVRLHPEHEEMRSLS
jgi:hypothetical protein